MEEDPRWSGGKSSLRNFRICRFMAQQWLVASLFILTVGLSIAELGSAAPTSGGVRPPWCTIFCIHHSSPLQSSISGPICMHRANGERFSVGSLDVRNANWICFIYNLNSADANTIGSIAGFASINWGAAIQVMTAVTIGTNNAIHETAGRLLYKMCFHWLP